MTTQLLIQTIDVTNKRMNLTQKREKRQYGKCDVRQKGNK